MKLQFTRTYRHSYDGIACHTYEAGTVHDLDDDQACKVAVSEGYAHEVKPAAKHETKDDKKSDDKGKK